MGPAATSPSRIPASFLEEVLEAAGTEELDRIRWREMLTILGNLGNGSSRNREIFGGILEAAGELPAAGESLNATHEAQASGNQQLAIGRVERPSPRNGGGGGTLSLAGVKSRRVASVAQRLVRRH